jgi:hypothetical protein
LGGVEAAGAGTEMLMPATVEPDPTWTMIGELTVPPVLGGEPEVGRVAVPPLAVDFTPPQPERRRTRTMDRAPEQSLGLFTCESLEHVERCCC